MPIYEQNKGVFGNIILEEAGKATEDAIVVGETPNRIIAEGTLQDLDVMNRNKRYYSTADMRPQIYGDRIAELVAAKQMKGEAGHPLSDSIVRQQTVDPKLVCVNYLKLWIDKNRVKAQFRGTNDDGYGKAFDADLRAGEKPAFSLRALGNIENINGKAYVKNLKVITYDHVIFPSHKAAYTEKVLTESAILQDMNVDIYNNKVHEMNESGMIIPIHGKDAQNLLNQMQHESAGIGAILETFEDLNNTIKIIDNNKIKLTSAYGESIYLNLDKYCENLIMEYTSSLF